MIKKILAITLTLLSISTLAIAKDATFSWTANTETNLMGYKIYEVGSINPPVDVGLNTLHTMAVPSTPTCYYATAYDIDGFESDPSNQACIDLPDAPLNFTVTINIMIP